MKVITRRERRMLAHDCAVSGCLCADALAVRERATRHTAALGRAASFLESAGRGPKA